MSQDELKVMLKAALTELSQEGHHTCLVFRSPEEQQMARDVVKVGKMTKMGFMAALVLLFLGGASLAVIGKLTGFLK
jgi:hypothetical protein